MALTTISSRLQVLALTLLASGGNMMPAGVGALPDPAVDLRPASGRQTAVLAGGCFWCTEAVFEVVEGVEDVISGYSGGARETAKYDIVST